MFRNRFNGMDARVLREVIMTKLHSHQTAIIQALNYNWTVVMVYSEEVPSEHFPDTMHKVWYGQKCEDVVSLRFARIFINEVCKPVFPNNEYLVIPYTEEKFNIEIERRTDMWTFNEKGEARPAWFYPYRSSSDERTNKVRERIETQPIKDVRVGDLVRIELTHYGKDDPQHNMVRRVTDYHPEVDWSAIGERSYGLIDYEIDESVDKRMPSYSDGTLGEYSNTCALSWVTEIVERAPLLPIPSRNRMHERWKRWSIQHKKHVNDDRFGLDRRPIHDPFHEERPRYSVQEAVRYILNRQATMDLRRNIDMDRMHAQLMRDMYPGCHFVEVGWSDFKRMALEVKAWKKFRKWVLKNHRNWVVAAKDLREDAIKAAKEQDERDMRDMDRDYGKVYRGTEEDEKDFPEEEDRFAESMDY